MNQRMQTVRQSLKAPGLPYFPRRSAGSLPDTGSRFLSVSSINYDYLPMNLESPKMLWVDLEVPPPDDLLVGTPIRLHVAPGRGIQTTLSADSPENSIFQLDDIVGSRLILNPYRGSAWLPTVHASCSSPFGWGYDTRIGNVSTSMHGAKYGYGVSIASIEYHPIKYSTRATELDAARIEEDWYRGSKHTPGWLS